MRSLTALDLWRTQVTGTLPAAWSAMQRLETLSVSDTLLAGTLPESWGELKHLKVLQVSWGTRQYPVPITAACTVLRLPMR